MTLRLAYNTTDSAVLVDQQGYFIGGRGWGVIDTLDPCAKRELAASRLVEADEAALAAATSNVDAQAAVEALRARRAAVEAARSLSKDELVEQLPDEVVESLPTGGDGLPAKDDLVDAAVDTGADLEAKEPTKGSAKKSTSSRRSGQN